MLPGEARSRFSAGESDQARRTAVKMHHGRLLVRIYGTMLLRAHVDIAASDQVGPAGGEGEFVS